MSNVGFRLSCALFFVLFTSCSVGSGEASKEKPIHEGVARAVSPICMNDVRSDGNCWPNVHKFFSDTQIYHGEMVTIRAYAAYSSRGSLVAYPARDFACSSLEYTGVEVVFEGDIDEIIQKNIFDNGFAKVEIAGRVMSASVRQGLPVVGAIDAENVDALQDARVVLRKNPKDLSRDSPDPTFFGDAKDTSCFR